MATSRKRVLVPIRGDRIRAALKRSGLSVSALARRVRAKQQTVDLIVRGKTSRCEQDLRATLARALGTSVAVLGGEEDPKLAFLAFVGDAEDLAETPIALRLFYLACSHAARRDKLVVDAGFVPPQIRSLVSPAYWRAQLLETIEAQLLADPDLGLSTAERDRLYSLLADAMGLLLKPWFDGRAGLSKRFRSKATPRKEVDGILG